MIGFLRLRFSGRYQRLNIHSKIMENINWIRIRSFIFIIIYLGLTSCSTSKIRVINNSLVHENLYKTAVLGENWMRFFNIGVYDVNYARCPGEQRIAIIHTKFASQWDLSEMKPQDYPKRIYQNSYYPGWEKGFLYNGGNSPIYDPNFRRTLTDPIIYKEREGFELLYESSLEGWRKLCGGDREMPITVKILDVFFRDNEFHFWCMNCTRFLVFRYMSTEDLFENGLEDFRTLVDQFHWLN